MADAAWVLAPESQGLLTIGLPLLTTKMTCVDFGSANHTPKAAHSVLFHPPTPARGLKLCGFGKQVLLHNRFHPPTPARGLKPASRSAETSSPLSLSPTYPRKGTETGGPLFRLQLIHNNFHPPTPARGLKLQHAVHCRSGCHSFTHLPPQGD
jgi:hypothetical protein